MIDEANLPVLPRGWVWTRVNWFCDTQTGPFGTQLHKSDYTDSGIPTIEIGDVHPTRDLREGTLHFISKKKALELKRFEVKTEDVLFSRVGTVGRCTLVPLGCDGWIMSTSLIRVRIISQNLLPKYLLFYFWSPVSQYFTQKTTKGTTRAGTNSRIVGELPLVVPPLPEQHRIVAKIEELFTKLDAGVEELKKVKAQLKRYRQAVLKYAFEGKLTEEWREAHKNELEPASVLLERIKEERKKKLKGKYKELPSTDTSELPKLQKEWVCTTVNWLCDTQTGPFGTQLHKSDYTYSGVPVIEIGDVHPTRDLREGTAHFVSYEKALELKRYEVKAGDVLFSRVGTVGRCTLVPLGCDGWIMSTSLIRVRIVSQILLPKYLLFYFWSPVSQYFTKKTTKGTTRAGTNSQIVGELPLIVSSLSEQYKIVEEIEHRFSIADVIEKIVDQSLKQADILRQSILKRAFEGKLVPQDPTDEPASVLLERIKAKRKNREIEAKSEPKSKNERKRELKQRSIDNYVKSGH
jgi:type I restriction enzyme S subunit